MHPLLLGISLFVATFALQALLWRARLVPRRPVVVLLLFVLVCASAGTAGEPLLPAGGADVARAFLLAAAIFMVYLSFYAGIELDSPSCLALMQVEAAGDRGAAREQLHALLGDQDVILSRLEELARGRLARERGGIFTATRAGSLFLRALRLVRRLFTRAEMEG